jgi:hypothetical protein
MRWQLRVKYQWTHFSSSFRVRRHIGKVLFESLLSLNLAVCYLTNFVAVETLPALSIELLEELDDENRIYEVDKRVAHVALIPIVNWQIEEVILVLLFAIQGLQEHRLSVLIWNIFDHNGCSLILAGYNFSNIKPELVKFRGLLLRFLLMFLYGLR